MPRYLSINLYSFTDLRRFGVEVSEVVNALFRLSPKYSPIKFRADLVDRKRNRYFKATEKNLQMLREELVAGAIREIEANDNEGREGVDPRLVYDTNLYHLAFSLDLTRPSERLAPAVPSSPNNCQFLFDMDAFTDSNTFGNLLNLCEHAFLEFASCWGDIYFCSNHHICFLHLLGSSQVQHRRDASEDFNTITIDRGRFFETLCDVLVRDAYFGVFLNPSHVRLLGGIELLRRDVPYEVIKELPNGSVFLMASSNPFDFDKPEVEQRIERLRDVLRPIAMFQFEDSREAQALAKRLRSDLKGGALG